jgi:hypothetical protein
MHTCHNIVPYVQLVGFNNSFGACEPKATVPTAANQRFYTVQMSNMPSTSELSSTTWTASRVGATYPFRVNTTGSSNMYYVEIPLPFSIDIFDFPAAPPVSWRIRNTSSVVIYANGPTVSLTRKTRPPRSPLAIGRRTSSTPNQAPRALHRQPITRRRTAATWVRLPTPCFR